MRSLSINMVRKINEAWKRLLELDRKIDEACTARLGEAFKAPTPLPNKALICDLVSEIAPPDERL